MTGRSAAGHRLIAGCAEGIQSRFIQIATRVTKQERCSSFQQAIALDPDFAMAYANLGRAYQVLGKGEPMTAALRKAYAMRDRASEREKFDIVAVYHQFVTLQIGETVRNCELGSGLLPAILRRAGFSVLENGVLGKYLRSARGIPQGH